MFILWTNVDFFQLFSCLPDLIGLHFALQILEIDQALAAREYKMAAPLAQVISESFQKRNQIGKMEIAVALAAHQLLKQFVNFAHTKVLPAKRL
jgi:hypothetical protein